MRKRINVSLCKKQREQLPQCTEISEAIQTAVLQNDNVRLFIELREHMLECAI